MQKRPSMVYIRRSCCSRRRFRCCVAYIVFFMIMLCLDVRLIWSLILAGLLTGIFRLFVIGRYL